MDKNQARAYALMAFQRTDDKSKDDDFLVNFDMLVHAISEDEVVSLAYDGGHENEKKVELG